MMQIYNGNDQENNIQVTRRSYKETEQTFPLLGFGLMRLPEKNGKIDETAAQQMIDRALECGVNYFDTAYMYHGGESERFVGRALAKYPRSTYYLTSKMPIHDMTSEADNEQIFNEQLERTKAGYFDFYFMHWLNDAHWEKAKRFKTWEFLKKMQAEGKIRRIGFSYHGEPEKLKEIAQAHPWDLVQIQLNYLDWEVYRSKEQYEVLTSLGIPVSIMEPLKGGALVKLSDTACSILKNANPNANIASWGLRFAASLPNVLIVLSGMSSPVQLEENLQTFMPFHSLSETERQTLNKALIAYRTSSSVPCTGCRYCSPCPQGVDIPRNLALHNQVIAQGAKFHAQLVYNAMSEELRADSCIACGECKSKCPQKIDIPSLMSKIADEFSA